MEVRPQHALPKIREEVNASQHQSQQSKYKTLKSLSEDESNYAQFGAVASTVLAQQFEDSHAKRESNYALKSEKVRPAQSQSPVKVVNNSGSLESGL